MLRTGCSQPRAPMVPTVACVASRRPTVPVGPGSPAPAIGTVPPAQTASAWAAVARSLSARTHFSASASVEAPAVLGWVP